VGKVWSKGSQGNKWSVLSGFSRMDRVVPVAVEVVAL
jgi:hypothetical protein